MQDIKSYEKLKRSFFHIHDDFINFDDFFQITDFIFHLFNS